EERRGPAQSDCRSNANNPRSSTACRWRERANDLLKFAPVAQTDHLTDRMTVVRRVLIGRPMAPTADQFGLRRKFLRVAMCAEDRTEFPRAVAREREALPCPFPSGAIPRRRATPR